MHRKLVFTWLLLGQNPIKLDSEVQCMVLKCHIQVAFYSQNWLDTWIVHRSNNKIILSSCSASSHSPTYCRALFCGVVLLTLLPSSSFSPINPPPCLINLFFLFPSPPAYCFHFLSSLCNFYPLCSLLSHLHLPPPLHFSTSLQRVVFRKDRSRAGLTTTDNAIAHPNLQNGCDFESDDDVTASEEWLVSSILLHVREVSHDKLKLPVCHGTNVTCM